MNTILKKILATAIAVTLLIPSQGLVRAQAAKKVALSEKSLTLTEQGVSYSLSIKNTSKKQKISWSFSSDNKEVTPISVTPAKNKKSVTVMALTGGAGTITCKVGKKKYKCRYTVSLPVVSNFSTLTDFIDQNGTPSTRGNVYSSEPQGAGTETYTLNVYSHVDRTDNIWFDLKGGDSTTQLYYSLSFILSADGRVHSLTLRTKKNNYDYWGAQADDISARTLTGKKYSFYKIIYPEYLTTPQTTSYQKMARSEMKTTLGVLDGYMKKRFGYGLDTLGF